MATTETPSTSTRKIRRLAVLAGMVTVAAILAACQNPLAVQLEERIQQDVAIAESGGPPTVVSFSPPADATNVRLDTTVTATFSQTMNGDTLTPATFTLTNTASGSNVAVTVTYDAEESQAILSPDAPLLPATTYRATIAAEGVRSDLDLRIEADVTWQFTTSVRPVATLSPADGAADVALSVNPTVSFDRPMDATSVESAISLADTGGTAVASTVTFDTDTNTATLVPSAALAPDGTYFVSVEATAMSATGVTLGSARTSEFTTIYYGATDLAFDVTYTGTLELSAERPVYVFAYALPLPSDFMSNADLHTEALVDYPITGDGRYVIPASDISADRTEFLIVLVHDLNSSFSADQSTEDQADTHRWIKTDVAGNTVAQTEADPLERDQEGSLVLDENANFIVKEEFIVAAGQEYVLEYYDESPAAADADEAKDDGAYRTLDVATNAPERTFHTFEDVDYFAFTPDRTDRYELRMQDSSMSTTVRWFETESDMLADAGPLSQSVGSAQRSLSPERLLQAGQTYYVRAEATDAQLGSYQLGVFLEDVAEDASEPDDVRAEAPALALGRDNAASRTLESNDDDWFAIDVAEGFTYILTVEENSDYFGAGAEARGIEVGLRLEDASGVSAGYADHYGAGTMVIDATENGFVPAGTWYVRVNNDSASIGTENQQPTAGYTITYTYGPDLSDQSDNPDTPGTDEYALFNEQANLTTYENVRVHNDGLLRTNRTIYSTESAQAPEEDVDWLRFSMGVSGLDFNGDPKSFESYLVMVEPVDGEDGVVVDFEVYPRNTSVTSSFVPDLSVEPRTGNAWTSDSRVKASLVDSFLGNNEPYGDYFIRIIRDPSYPNNPLTGGYRVSVMMVADEVGYSADSALNGSQEPQDGELTIFESDGTTPHFTGRVDETPWMGYRVRGSSSGLNYSDRNQLQWTADSIAADARIDSINRSIHLRDYNNLGEPDEVTGTDSIDASSDWDFHWFQVPDGGGDAIDKVNINIQAPVSYAVPLRVTIWHLTSAQFDAVANDTTTDHVVTEAELNATVSTPPTYTLRYLPDVNTLAWDENGDGNSDPIPMTGLSTDDYVFMKIERDGSAPATFTHQNGDTRDYGPTGAYTLSVTEFE